MRSEGETTDERKICDRDVKKVALDAVVLFASIELMGCAGGLADCLDRWACTRNV